MIGLNGPLEVALLIIVIAIMIILAGHLVTPRTEPMRASVITARVVCAANRYADGTITLGLRHHDAWMQQHVIALRIETRRPNGPPEQGFIDNHGSFLTRKEAWVIAETAGQIVRRCGADGPEAHGLFSENLY